MRHPAIPARAPVGRRLLRAGALVAGLLVTAGTTACSDDDAPGAPASAAPATASPPPATWNPCDALGLEQVSAWFGTDFTKDAGTPAQPSCTFAPEVEGDPVVNANYAPFAGELAAAFEAMGVDPDDVRELQVPGADAARVVVDFDDRQLFVSGFVQDGDIIQTVDVVDPRPYDEARAVRAVRAVLTALSAAAPAPSP